MNRGSILNYGFKGERLDKLKDLAYKMNLLLRPVDDNDLGEIVENLLKREAVEAREMQELPTKKDFEYLLFCDISRETLTKFLKKSHEDGLFVGYKAGLTETNRYWKLDKLIAENIKEHHTMLRINRARQALEYISENYADKLDMLEDELLRSGEIVGNFVKNPESKGLEEFNNNYPIFMKAFKKLFLKENQ